jgi:hypothetical protein
MGINEFEKTVRGMSDAQLDALERKMG